MGYPLKQGVGATVPIGPFVDDTDGVTPEQALTISQADVRLSKNGADPAQKNESSSATHKENGRYAVVLDTTDTNTAGSLRLDVYESGALPVTEYFTVYPAAVYDALFSTSNLAVDVVSISGDTTAADNLELDYDGTGYDKTNSATGLLSTAVDDIWDESILGHANINTVADFIQRVKYGIDTLHSYENHQGRFFFMDATNGSDANNGLTRSSAKQTWSAVNALVTTGAHDTVILVNSTGATETITEAIDINKIGCHVVGPNDGTLTIKPTADTAPSVTLSADATHLQGVSVETAATGTQPAIKITADKCVLHAVDIPQSRGHGVYISSGNQNTVRDAIIQDAGTAGADHGIFIDGTSIRNLIYSTRVVSCNGAGIRFSGSGVTENTVFAGDLGVQVTNNTGYGIMETAGAAGNIVYGPGVEVNANTGGAISMEDPASIVSNVSSNEGYANGYIYIDTVNGTPGQVKYFNGTVENASYTLTDAIALSVATKLNQFYLTTGSSLTPAVSMDNYVIRGECYTLDLNGQSFSDAHVYRGTVTGTCTGANAPHFIDCDLTTVVLPPCIVNSCTLNGITVGSAGTFVFKQCCANTTLDLGAAIGATTLNMFQYCGEITFQNIKAGDVITITGDAKITLDSSCTGGTLNGYGILAESSTGTTTVSINDGVVISAGDYMLKNNQLISLE